MHFQKEQNDTNYHNHNSFPTCSALYQRLLSFGLPLTVLCHTMGKLVLEQKFCVTAMVVSRLSTTCQ